MDVTSEVEVEGFHRNDLRITTSSCSTLDTEGGSLTWLAYACDDLLVEVGTEALAQADGGCRFALTKRCGRNASDANVLATGCIL